MKYDLGGVVKTEKSFYTPLCLSRPNSAAAVLPSIYLCKGITLRLSGEGEVLPGGEEAGPALVRPVTRVRLHQSRHAVKPCNRLRYRLQDECLALVILPFQNLRFLFNLGPLWTLLNGLICT